MSPGARERRLRLLQVNPTPGWRGGEAQTLFLCRGLVERGHEVLLAAAPGEELLRRARTEGIAVRGVAIRGDGDLIGVARLAGVTRAFRPDLVHLHTSRAHAAGWALSFLFPAPGIVVSRRVDFEPARDPFTRLKYTTRVHRFIAVSDRVAQVLREAGVDPRRIRRVYSGVPARARPDPARLEALRGEIGLPERAPVIGTVGALASHKDPLTLVRAFARLPRSGADPARLLFVGDGELRGAVLAESVSLGVAPRVVVTGFRENPHEWLALLDLFVAPSRLEGLNTSILDAMSLGLPIVATRAGGIPEIVEDGKSGVLVPPGDAAALSAAIAGLLEDPARALSLARAARTRSESFRETRMVEETEAVYRELLSEPALGGRAAA